MALTTEQEIQIAKQRVAQGKGSALDAANIKSFENRSLSGTLSGTKSGGTTGSSTTRSLPEEQGQLANFQSVMRQLQNANIKAQPSPVDKLKDFQAVTGVEARSTGAITGAIEMGERERLENIVERAKTAVDLVSEQEKRKEQQRQDNVKWAEMLFQSVENPFSVFSSEDISNIKMGIVTPDMTERVKAAQKTQGDFQFIQGTEDQPGGVFNKTTGTFSEFTDMAKGIVGGFDISSYATDPAHEEKVDSILSRIGKFNTLNDVSGYISKQYPNSPITAQMIGNTSAKYGVPWEMLVAMMEQDSSLGTAGIGARNNNPGNIGQFDSLGTTPTKGYPTMQAGVDAVGAWLSRHRAKAPEEVQKDADGWVTLINSGKAKLSDVPQRERKNVVNAMAKSGVISNGDAAMTSQLHDKVSQIQNLIDRTSNTAAVGPNPLARLSLTSWATGKVQSYIAGVEQLVSQGTLDALINLKARGGALGALSDAENAMLRSSASKIGSWTIKNKEGKVVGYDVDEGTFKKELEQIKKLTEQAINNAGGDAGVVMSLEQNLAKNPARVDEYNAIVEKYPNLTDDEISQLLGFK